jgi:hypothetical protein
MPRFVHVSPQFEGWLKKAIEFAKRNEGPVVGAVVGYLLSNGVPHDTKEQKEHIPAGHHYFGG